MIQDFITTQLLNDSDWQAFLETSIYQKVLTKKTAVERLRSLLIQGMKEEKKEVEAIILTEEKPTFENTIVALSKSGFLLSRVTTILYNLLSAETNDALDNLANEIAPVLSEHENDITLNPNLFARIKTVYDNPPSNMDPEDRTLLDKTYQSFERSGATLSREGQEKFREITLQLSQETIRFSQNLLKETNNYILHIQDEKELSGIPLIHREAAALEAKERNLSGWVFTLKAPSFTPFMMYSDLRHYREEMYKAYHMRCTHDNEYNNIEVVRKIINLRRELAVLLGYSDYAEFALKRRMAGSSSNVYKLLYQLTEHYLRQARDEVNQIVRKSKSLEGKDFNFKAWDFAYYSQKLKKEIFNYDPDKLRPYFLLSNVVNGVLGLATKLYGITFERDNTVPVYHEDVQCYKIYDADHSYLALLFLDFFPRKGKQSGAWMTTFRDEHSDATANVKVTAQNSVRPVVSVTTNFTKPTDETPSLLTLGEVETFLHEFGHALHGIFAMTHHASLSGTSVFWDFVELPSQFMENFSTEPEFLETFAYHYKTNELLPKKVIEQIQRVRNFQVAYACIRQVSFGLLDMAYYTLKEPFTDDIKKFEQQVWKKTQLLPLVPEACMSVQFSHIIAGGYAAGYYSYKWSEVLDADAFSLFKENGVFNVSLANKFREYVLSKGGIRNPMELYVEFRGQEPTIEALLKRDGIVS